MRDPFDTRINLDSSSRQSSDEFISSRNVTRISNGDAGNWTSSSDSLTRNNLHRDSGTKTTKDEHIACAMDPELMELCSRSRSQEDEISLLHKQIADASVKELLLLKEKHLLERKLADLRMALDEKQDDAISAAMKDLSLRKGCIEENIRLAHDLQDAEEEVYIFTSSLITLLAEYNVHLPMLNASTIANSAKRLYQNLEWKLRISDAGLDQKKHLLGYQPGDAASKVNRQPLQISSNQQPQPNLDTRPDDIHRFSHYPVDPHVEATSNQPREHGGNYVPNYQDYNRETIDPLFYIPTPGDRQPSPGSDGEISLPGIDGFQIVGDAKPGSTLLACGYPVNGTTVCNFQWVRLLENGTRQSIEGAQVPQYVVTADDVGAYLAVDCTPMDDNGRQGELVRQFANNQHKITCDSDMQHEIDTYISGGSAIFTVFLLAESSEAWEQATLILKRTGYQIKVYNSSEADVKEEKYSPELYISVPVGQSTQFVLTCSDGTILPFSTSGTTPAYNFEDSIRLRDLIVLTMRHFQAKAIDGKRKWKA